MSDPRDKTRRTPAAGVAVRGSTQRDRDEYVSKSPLVTVAPAEMWPDDEGTPVHGTNLEQLNSRSKRTLSASLATVTQLGEVRTELREDIGGVRDEVRALGEHVGNLREGLGEVNGTLKVMVTTLVEREKAQTVKLNADTEVDKQGKLAVIDDTKDARRFRRDLITKIVAAALGGGGLATVATLLASKC